VRAAAAQVILQCRFDLGDTRFGILPQKRRRLHDHAVDAIAALYRLFFDEGALQFVRLCQRAESLKRGDFVLTTNRRQWLDTGAHGFAIHVDRARAALTESAAEVRAMKVRIVAQEIKERR